MTDLFFRFAEHCACKGSRSAEHNPNAPRNPASNAERRDTPLDR
jgi:hypothetical protein